MRLKTKRQSKHGSIADIIMIWLFRFAIIGIIVWLIWAQNNFVMVDNLLYQDDDVPKQFVGYKIVHISDFMNSNLDIINKVKKLDPDIIVLTGGYSDDNDKYDNVVKQVNKLNQIAPVYYIYNPGDLGNELQQTTATNITDSNVLLSPRYNNVEDFIKNVYGNEILDKANEQDEEAMLYLQYVAEEMVKTENSQINLFGFDLYYEENEQYAARDKAYQFILDSPVKFNMALLSNVYVIDEVCKANINMMMFGGTFGTNKISNEYIKGIYGNNGTQLFVSSGIGKTNSVKRIFNFPTIQCITLSDKTIQPRNPLERFLDYFISDVGTIYDNDGGFEIYNYTYGGDKE